MVSARFESRWPASLNIIYRFNLVVNGSRLGLWLSRGKESQSGHGVSSCARAPRDSPPR